MPDREKVIKGLEEISDYFFSIYHHSKDREEINKAKDRCDAVEDAISLLKEQEAKPVELHTNAYGTKFYFCPKCKRELFHTRNLNFCERCGQEVKWE